MSAGLAVRAARVLPVFVLAVFPLACTGGTSEAPTLVRLLPRDSLATFERLKLLEVKPNASWSFVQSQGELPEGWSVVGQGRESLRSEGASGLVIPPSNGVAVKGAVQLRARDVQVVEVDLHGLRRGALRLSWSSSAVERSRPRQLVVDAESGPPYRFRVGAHPDWRADIRSLRLDFVGALSHGPVELRRIAAGRWSLDPERVEAAEKRPWRVDLKREVRPALLGVPGRSHRFRLPEGSANRRLEIAVGLMPWINVPMQFQAAAFYTSGERVAGVQCRLDPRRPADSGWRELRMELTSSSALELVLSVHAEGGAWSAIQGYPVWGDPQIVTPEPRRRRPDLLLVSIDTLRADHLSLYGYDRPTSPRLEAWARDAATVFRRVVAPAPWTLPSHATMLTGLDPLAHGMNFRMTAPASIVTLAERLAAAGYATYAMTGGGWLHPTWGLDQGFDTYSYTTDAETADETRLEVALERTRHWIETHHDRPTFVFFHTYEVHEPFRPKEPWYTQFGGKPLPEGSFFATEPLPTTPDQRVYRRLVRRGESGDTSVPLDGGEIAQVVAAYDSRIARTDELLGGFLDSLQSQGLADDRAIVITSDHGEAFGEKGLAGHANLYEANVLIPLLIAWPNGHHVTEVDEQVRLVDVPATLLELAGLPPIEGDESYEGRSLLSLLQGSGAERPSRAAWSYAASSNGGLSLRLGDGLEYLFFDSPWANDPVEELYRLSEDPSESRDLAPSSPGEVSRLQRNALERLATLGRGLDLWLRNATSTPAVVLIRGDDVEPTTAKRASAPCGCITWRGREVGIRVELAPAREVRLRIADHARGVLQLSPGDEAGGWLTLEPNRDGVVVLSWTPSSEGWRSVSADRKGTLSAVIQRLGGVEDGTNGRPDEELQRQLESLGYLGQ